MDAMPCFPRTALIAMALSLLPYGAGGFAGAASQNANSTAMVATCQAQAAAKFGGSRPSSVYIARTGDEGRIHSPRMDRRTANSANDHTGKESRGAFNG